MPASNEGHIGSLKDTFQEALGGFGSLPPHIGLPSGPQAFGEHLSKEDLGIRLGHDQLPAVGVDGHSKSSVQAHANQPAGGVAPGAAAARHHHTGSEDTALVTAPIPVSYG
jgi:hypothetical protein